MPFILILINRAIIYQWRINFLNNLANQIDSNDPVWWNNRVGKGISAQASPHRTVREALTSYGSYHIIKRV